MYRLPKRKALKVLIFPALFVGVLFWLSHQDGESTVKQSYFVMGILEKVNISVSYAFFRDIMHVVVFGLIGFAIIIGLASSVSKPFYRLVFSLLFLTLLAMSDEYHQGFIDGRTVSHLDLMLDMIGGVFGIFLGLIMNFVFRKIWRNKKTVSQG